MVLSRAGSSKQENRAVSLRYWEVGHLSVAARYLELSQAEKVENDIQGDSSNLFLEKKKSPTTICLLRDTAIQYFILQAEERI